MTIFSEAIEGYAAEARAWSARGFTRLTVPVGGAGPDEAIARVLAVHVAAPAAELILEGEGALSAPDAIAVLRALHESRVRPILFEQPCAKHDVGGLLAVAAASDVPVVLDESVSTLTDLSVFTLQRQFDAARFVLT